MMKKELKKKRKYKSDKVLVYASGEFCGCTGNLVASCGC